MLKSSLLNNPLVSIKFRSPDIKSSLINTPPLVSAVFFNLSIPDITLATFTVLLVLSLSILEIVPACLTSPAVFVILLSLDISQEFKYPFDPGLETVVASPHEVFLTLTPLADLKALPSIASLAIELSFPTCLILELTISFIASAPPKPALRIFPRYSISFVTVSGRLPKSNSGTLIAFIASPRSLKKLLILSPKS